MNRKYSRFNQNTCNHKAKAYIDNDALINSGQSCCQIGHVQCTRDRINKAGANNIKSRADRADNQIIECRYQASPVSSCAHGNQHDRR